MIHLTNLPNRRSFMNQLRSEVMDRKFSRSKLSVFFIDLDNFKQINDQWGHDAGDLVLKEAAKRIQSVIRPTDIVARFGGDEFVVMLKDVQDEEDAITIVQRMLKSVSKSYKRIWIKSIHLPAVLVWHTILIMENLLKI